MMVLLRFATNLGPRTIVVEMSDRAAAQAAVNAHLAASEPCSPECPSAVLVEETPRLSVKDFMARHKRAMAKAAKLTVISTPSNVTALRKGRRG